jgi:hypothetical protein
MSTFYVNAPSYFAQVANGLLIFVFLYILFSNYRVFLKTNYITQLQIIGILAILIGVHGILHVGLEQLYQYNPLLFFVNI